jgi:TatA/E family protein of Tat protein translocase
MIGPQDLWVALALGVFFFGAKRLPELSRSLGQALSEFKRSVTGTEPEKAEPPILAPNVDRAVASPKPEKPGVEERKT